MPLRCLRRNPDVAQADEVQSASMRQRLVSSPAGSAGEPLPVESTLAKMTSLALLSQATRSPSAHGPQRTFANGSNAGLRQVHLASNRVSLKPAHCMRGLLRFDTAADPWRTPRRVGSASANCQNHASRSGLIEFACRETALIYWTRNTVLFERNSSAGRKASKVHYKIGILSR